MATTTRTAIRQKVSRKLYSGHDVIISTAELIRKDSGTDVNESFAAADTTLTVDDGTKITAGDLILINDEIISVTSISGNDLTVVRGGCGTTDVDHADNSDIYIYNETGQGISPVTLCDSKLAPTAEEEDFVGAWIYISTQPTAVASGALLDEASNITATQTNFDVDVSGSDDASGFAPGDGIQLDDEIMRVTAVNLSTDDLTVVRGIQDTTAATHDDNVIIYKIGPAVGEITRITDVDFSAKSSLLTLFPALSARLVSGQEYEIHYKFYPTKIHQKIDEILEDLRRPIWMPLTLITDGDMEDDPATNFTALTCTLTNETTTVLRGRQSLKLVATATPGIATSGNVYLPPDTEVFFSTDCYVTLGDSVKVALYDPGNSETIETAESDSSGWVHLEFVATTPSNCEYVYIQLWGQSSVDIIYFDNVVLLPTGRKIYDYPATLEWSEDLDGIFYYPRGTSLSGSGNDNAFAIFENKAEKWSDVSTIRDETAVTPYRLQVHKTPINRTLFVRGLVDFSTLSSDSTTTYAPEDIVVDLVYAKMLDLWADSEIEDGRTEGAAVKEARAERTRNRLSFKMQHFRPNKGKIKGAM